MVIRKIVAAVLAAGLTALLVAAVTACQPAPVKTEWVIQPPPPPTGQADDGLPDWTPADGYPYATIWPSGHAFTAGDLPAFEPAPCTAVPVYGYVTLRDPVALGAEKARFAEISPQGLGGQIVGADTLAPTRQAAGCQG